MSTTTQTNASTGRAPADHHGELEGDSPSAGGSAGSRRSRRRRWAIAGGLIAVAIAAGLGAQQLASGGEPSTPEAVEAPVRDVPRLEDGRIVYSEAFSARAGLSLATVEMREVVPLVRASGAVAFDPRRVAVVGSRIAARVVSVEVVPGQRVAEGDVLAKLEAAELANVQADLEVLRARRDTAVAEAERKRMLADEGIAAQRSAQVADTERRALQIELDATRRRVRALGGGSSRARMGSFVLRAPIAGEVVHVGVEPGQPIDPNYNAFRVADLSDVWAELAVFERELGSVHRGDAVVLAPRSRPDTRVRGTVDHVGAVLDPRTRSATVRVVVDNEARALAVGESIVADIATQSAAVRAPSVPRNAVVLVDGHSTVFVAIAPGTVASRRVEIAAEGERWIAVRDGVREGESVVVDGVFALKSELFR